MPDIFISYSRKDSEQALSLAERLRNEGMSVWIDQQGIEAAKTWSEEIVNAIEASKAFVLLLSQHSVESANVAKEVAIAFESDRMLVPVTLSDVALTPKLKYALAGVQRVSYNEFDKLAAALKNLGIAKGRSTTTAEQRLARSSSNIIVLPFDDVSPTHENGWFADGLTIELIGALSSVKGLRPVDRQTTMSLKDQKLSMLTLSQSLGVRYFLEGAVRKFGEEIKISVSLFDLQEGEYLWQDTHRGTLADIFGIQEAVAQKVVEAMHVNILPGVIISEHHTQDPIAYEHYLKGTREHSLHTKDSYSRAIEFFRAAIAADPSFVAGFEACANTLLEMYRTYEKDPEHLREAEKLIDRSEALTGNTARWLWLKSKLAFARRDLASAEHFARLTIDSAPDRPFGYDALGLALEALDKRSEAAEIKGINARLDPRPNTYFSWLVSVSQLEDPEQTARAAREALPIFTRHRALDPKNQHLAVQLTHMYLWAGEPEKARTLGIEMLKRTESMDSKVLYNLGCVFGNLGDISNALTALRASVEKGFTNLYQIQTWSASPGFAESEEYQSIIASVKAANDAAAIPNA